jgi:protein TonB
LSPELDREAVRVVKLMPKWNPGRLNGVPVRVKYIIPVRFNAKQ